MLFSGEFASENKRTESANIFFFFCPDSATMHLLGSLRGRVIARFLPKVLSISQLKIPIMA
jgi:hypothetical protein